MLDDGLMHEHDIIDRLRSKGFKVLYDYAVGQLEVVCYSRDGLEIVGHPDGVLDLPKSMERFELDYADSDFVTARRYYMLEVTSRSSFVFQRLLRHHMSEVLAVKYVQVQMYLNSAEMREHFEFPDGVGCCVCVVKNKNTSELYEEGIAFHPEVVLEAVEKLKRVEDAVSRGLVLPYKCADWRSNYCRYRNLCFAEPTATEVAAGSDVVLDGSTLKEAAYLEELAEQWKIGSPMRREGAELVDGARYELQDIIEQYGVKGIRISGVNAMMVDSHSRSTDYDTLKRRHPDVYDEVVVEKPTRYVKVT